MASIQAGDLRERVAFGRLGSADGEGGNYRGGVFAPQFEVAAHFKPLNGGEEVMAGRLAGRRSVVMTIRSSNQTRAITAAMNVQDLRTKEVFNVREIKDPDGKRAWLEVLAESGVAS